MNNPESVTRQEALATENARLRALFNSAIDFAMVVTDPDGIIVDWDPGAEHVMGWNAQDMCGSDAARFFTPEDRADGRLEHEMQQALRHGRATDERWYLRRNGERFWASGEMMPLFDGDTHLGFVKILRDRTEEHLSGAALRQAQSRF